MWTSAALFQRTIHLWLALYVLLALPAAEALWRTPVAPPLPPPPGPFSVFTHAFQSWLPAWSVEVGLALLLVLGVRGMVRPARWYFSLLAWVLFTSSSNLAWLSANGGHHLLSNVLFWSIFLSPGRGSRGSLGEGVALMAFWMIRIQLVLAYLLTALLKLTGTHWPDGTALGIVVSDPAYGPAWLVGRPTMLQLLGYGVLLFQMTMPLALWWPRLRIGWMVSGAVFHLATGLAFDILDMGLAFICVYPIWLEPSTVDGLRGSWNRCLSRIGNEKDR